MKKSTAWIGTILALLISVLILIFGLTLHKGIVIIIGIILCSLYISGIIILIIDYFQTR